MTENSDKTCLCKHHLGIVSGQQDINKIRCVCRAICRMQAMPYPLSTAY